MSRARLRPAARALAAALAGATAAALAGCITLLPKQIPAQLYRFDARAAPAVAPAEDAPRVLLITPPVTLSPAVAGDRMLTVTGSQAAYVAGARWVSPAAVLWDEAVRRAFAARSARVRLLTRSELAGGGGFLRLDVPEFEVRYAAPGAPPAVHVTLHALLAHRGGAFAAERTFTADAPAAEDRVSAIVSAYDAAVEQAVSALVAWTDSHAAEALAEPAAAAAPAARAAVVTTTTSTSTSSSHAASTSRRP